MKEPLPIAVGAADQLVKEAMDAHQKELERGVLQYERLANGISQAIALLETQAYQPTPNLMTIRAVLNILKSL